MAPRIFRVEREQPVLEWLFEQLPEQKRGDIKRLLRFGSVYVNGMRVSRHDKVLQPGDNVLIERGQRSGGPASPPGIDIVYEDSDLVVVNKPVGLLTVATAFEKERTVHHELNAFYRKKEPRHGDRIYVVHRIDRETSGLLVFARNSATHRALQDAWPDVVKRYYAVVEGLPRRPEGTLRSHLAQDSSMHVKSVRPGGDAKLAVTHYRVIREGRSRALLEVELETGRKNQIRVHMAEMGHPVVGDPKYGTKIGPGGRLALHAYRLAFTHPTTREPMNFETELPTAFARMLER